MLTFKTPSSVSSILFPNTFLRVAGMLALFFIAGSAIWLAKAKAQNASSGQTQPAQEVITLELGKPIERELSAEQRHSFGLYLGTRQFLYIVVEQRCIDVAVTLIGPDGLSVAQVDSPNGNQGLEVLAVITPVAGNYRLDIHSIEQNTPPGKYIVRVTELRSATEKEIELANVVKPHTLHRLTGDQSHNYDFNANEGDYLHVIVEQRGIDVELLLLASDNQRLSTVDSPNGTDGPEEITYTIEKTGKHRLVIHSLEKNAAPGAYSVTLLELRLPTQKDRLLREAKKLHEESIRLRNQKQYKEALSLAERAVETASSAPQNLPVYLGVTAQMDELLNNLEKLFVLANGFVEGYEQAQSFYQSRLMASEKTFGPKHRAFGYWVDKLAGLHYSAGDFQKVIPLYERLIPVYDDIFKCKSSTMRHPRRILANLYSNSGNYDKAESLYQQVWREWERDYPGNLIIGVGLSEIANILISKGDFIEAEKWSKRSLIFREEAAMRGRLDPTLNIDAAFSLQQLGYLSGRLGNYADAENYLLRAITIMEKAMGNYHVLATTLSLLGDQYLSQGNIAKAEQVELRALEIMESQLGAYHPNLTSVLMSLSRVYSRKKDYVKAEELLRRALSIYERAPGLGHPRVATFLERLSVLRLLKGDWQQALTLRSQSFAISERVVSRNLIGGSERQKLAFLSIFLNEFNRAASLHIQVAPTNTNALRFAFTTALLRKGRALDAMLDTTALIRSRADQEDQLLFDRLLNARTRYAALVLGGAGRTAPVTYKQQLALLQEQIDGLEVELGRRNAEFQTQLKPITLDAIQLAIPDQAALVEFVRYAPYDAETDKNKADRYVVYVLTNQGEPRWSDLGEAIVIDHAVEAMRQALQNPKKRNYTELARDVDKKVMEPVRKLVGSKTELLLSPDGMLNLLPFAALMDKRGKYLIEYYSVSYLSSGRDLLRLRNKQESNPTALVLANPDFDHQPSTEVSVQRDIKPVSGGAPSTTLSFDFENAKFNPVLGTAGEAQGLKRLMPEATVLTREQATETAIKQVSRPRLLHIATHGFFLPDLNLNVSEASGGETVFSTRAESPLLRSGLALAGANKRKSGDDDGILTALEAAGLDLWGTKLVVLSACNTGIGEVKNGDGVYGLRRAFVLAGSETQVMSLWSVSDQGTKELMVEYYKRLLRGEGRGEALRQVQLQMLKNPKRRHPFYWASFIQSGEWANLDGKR